ncbi:acyl carrier protein [Kitasatospora sp. NPDC058170]|uniref:acyl carrier protein n=1 Tax=Kitasatospora sp. NPDC058170 TaxID=3346364 RepID=UPI0036DEA07E
MDNGVSTGLSTVGESELTDQVRKAWAEVLDLDDPAQVPLDTNFLEAGGSSLLLIMLWEELHGLTELQLKVSDLFEHSTVRGQARLLAGTATRAQASAGAEQRANLLGRVKRAS